MPKASRAMVAAAALGGFLACEVIGYPARPRIGSFSKHLETHFWSGSAPVAKQRTRRGKAPEESGRGGVGRPERLERWDFFSVVRTPLLWRHLRPK